MISFLSGKVLELNGSAVTLDVHGVGYEVLCSRQCSEKLAPGGSGEIVVYTDVKEDSIKLYGFADRAEKQAFLLLLSVSGVGPKSASDIISQVDKCELMRCIGAGDVTRLQAIKGIGKKTSERIVVELKDRIAAFAMAAGESSLRIEKHVTQPFQDAVEALVTLGFSRKDSEIAVQRAGSQAPAKAAESAELIKEALRYV